MKNILYTIILSFLFSSGVFGDWKAGFDAYKAGDYATAHKEWIALARQGNPLAQMSLADMYVERKGVTQDYKKAVYWYRLAAEQGFLFAQTSLGVMYDNGLGVIQDSVLAHMWLNIAASNGDEQAKKNRDIVERRISPEQLAEANRLARECVKKNYKDCG